MQVQSSVAYPPKEPETQQDQPQDQKSIFKAVLDESNVAKILKVANQESAVPTKFPHCTNHGATEYMYEPATWWTTGFFPGSLWALVERASKRQMSTSFDDLVKVAKRWEDAVESQKYNINTHDIGFMIMPSFQRDLDVTGNKVSAEVIITAADSLMTRWSDTVQCFRSWNSTRTKEYEYNDKDKYFLVIIDNMMNLDLLYSASLLSGDPKYAEHATKHSETTLKHHIRADDSTYHLIVYDATNGDVMASLTHQGYQHESTWSRGQAWALYGYATVYKYTKDRKFLDAAKRLANYFMTRVEDGVVYWDFDAPRPCVWDVSAAMIACSGMLLICQLENNLEYLPQVTSILKACVNGALTPENGVTILDHSTVNNHEHANVRIADTGLVYADYYFLEVGNRLIDMGLA